MGKPQAALHKRYIYIYIYIYIHPIIKLCVYRIDMCMMENVLSNSCMTKLKATGNC